VRATHQGGHAKQFKRANRSLRKLKTYLGRVIRDIRRKTAGNEGLRETFVRPLYLAERVLAQDRHQRGRKTYSLHAPEVECIGKGKAHKPYEFGGKVSVATPLRHSRGGQFVAHVAALPGNPYDGHTLATVIPPMQAILGNKLDRVIADAGYRGHNASPEYQFKIYTAGQKRRTTPQIKRDMRRRAAVEPVIGHLKEDHRMGRNYLAHSSGDERRLRARWGRHGYVTDRHPNLPSSCAAVALNPPLYLRSSATAWIDPIGRNGRIGLPRFSETGSGSRRQGRLLIRSPAKIFSFIPEPFTYNSKNTANKKSSIDVLKLLLRMATTVVPLCVGPRTR
jgi:hypothetical protein